MRLHAFILNNQVVKTESIDEDSYRAQIKNYEAIVDIEDMSPQPQMFWVLNGNKIEPVDETTTAELIELEKNRLRRIYGKSLKDSLVDKIGARNKILSKDSSFITTMASQLGPLGMLMDSGSLKTPRLGMLALLAVYTDHADILNEACNQIQSFLESIGDWP